MTDDDTLILYYYGDGLTDVRRAAVAAALEQDAALAARYRALCADLERLPLPAAEAPGGAREGWHRALDAAARSVTGVAASSAAPRTAMQRSVWPLSLAAVLALGIALGVHFGGVPAPQSPAGGAPTAAAAGEGARVPRRATLSPALTRGLTDHLERSRLRLASLDETSTDQRLELLGQVIAQNRLFERAAEAGGAPELARVLRSFERVLLSLGVEGASEAELAARREQLAFELQAMLTRLSRQPSDSALAL